MARQTFDRRTKAAPSSVSRVGSAGRSKLLRAAMEPLEHRMMFAGNPVPLGDDFRVNTTTAGVQRTFSETHGAVAMDDNGDSIVTWSSFGQDGDGYGVYSQRYTAAGAPQGGEKRVNETTRNFQVYASAAMDAAGDSVITWSSLGQDGDSYGIYAQRYDAAGLGQDGEFRVNTVTAHSQAHSSVAMDDAGDFVVSWTSVGQDGSGGGIYAQRFNSLGESVGNEIAVNTTTLGEQIHSSVAMDADGDFIITWGSSTGDGSGYGVYAQRYNSAGVTQGDEFLVNTQTTANQRDPTVAMNSAGNFVISWTSSAQDGNKAGIYAQRYNAAGSAVGDEFRVNSTTTGEQTNSSVAMDSNGDFIVSWSSQYQDGDHYGVYAQRYNAAGVAQQGELLINTHTAGDQWFQTAAMDADGDFMIAWTSMEQDGSEHGVYARRYAGVTGGGVVDRRLFLNNSSLDGNNAAANSADEAAIMTGKSPLLPGGTITTANVAGYSKGINGIMIDISGLPAGAVLTTNDFSFRKSTAGSWATGPTPTSITIRPQISSGVDRITLIWPESGLNGAVQNGWLEVTVKASGNTGLAAADVFAFGNLVADANGDGAVSVGDLGILATNFNKPSGATIAQGDFNGDGAVSVGDLGLLATFFNRTLAAPPTLGLLAAPEEKGTLTSKAVVISGAIKKRAFATRRIR